METDSKDFKNLIFDLMNGDINLDKFSCEDSELVKNEFAEDKLCGKVYEDIYNAKYRLCEKLCTDEDTDIECIFTNFSIIIRELCMKMYDYGRCFKKTMMKIFRR